QGYFKGDGKGKPEPHRPHVLDFSASGCLFVLPKSSYPVKLKQAAVLDLGIRAPSLDLLCKGRVVRRFEDRENEYYGVSFLGLDEGGMAALRELLYADRSSSMPSDETVYSG
ncbi:MAG TPA: PilZ domain-containing protein, partial [Spirochaetales bacterium]|nr:PilZ domain-containing protein [Spirochaetales bacterium]